MTCEPKQVPENAARRVSLVSRRRSPNYASREETMEAVKQIMDEDAEVFRRLANA